MLAPTPRPDGTRNPVEVWRHTLPGYMQVSGEGDLRGYVMPTRKYDDPRQFRPSRSCAYEGWTVAELKKRAKQLGICGYSGLDKARLISLIRSY